MNGDNQWSGAVASLEILTGPARGTACWLNEHELDISLNDEDMIRIVAAGGEPLQDGLVARLHRVTDSYEIEARADYPLWINGKLVQSKKLEARDLIEFGDKGPLSRFRLNRQGDRLRRSLGDMLDDAIDYTRASRRPRIQRVQKAASDLFWDFTIHTTILFRVSVVITLVILGIVAYQQYRSAALLQQQAEASALQLEDFALLLGRTRHEALRPADLNRLRQELSQSLNVNAERLKLLEKRGAAITQVIAEATRSIIFLQGAYAFRDAETGRMLRYRIDEEGNSLFSFRGEQLFTLEGEGGVAELKFHGTGFLVSQQGDLLTNRHVVRPWEDDVGLAAMLGRGLEPELIRLLGYLPGVESAYNLEVTMTSSESDLALVRCENVTGELSYLRLGVQLPKPGDEVVVMGYPTGLRSMLAQTGDRFLAELQEDENLDSWAIAERLSRAGFIRPLASRGIIGQRSESTVVYDAETTYGGSGGPVLDINGNVIAVNTAIIPEYGGSNFGIPIEFARRLLAAAAEAGK